MDYTHSPEIPVAPGAEMVGMPKFIRRAIGKTMDNLFGIVTDERLDQLVENRRLFELRAFMIAQKPELMPPQPKYYPLTIEAVKGLPPEEVRRAIDEESLYEGLLSAVKKEKKHLVAIANATPSPK